MCNLYDLIGGHLLLGACVGEACGEKVFRALRCGQTAVLLVEYGLQSVGAGC